MSPLNIFPYHIRPSIRHQDARFIQALQSIEHTLKRSLNRHEMAVLFSCDDNQAELIQNLLKEATNNEYQSEKASS